jgi:amidase
MLGKARPVLVAGGSFDSLYWAFRRIQGRESWVADGELIEKYKLPLGPGVAERFTYAKAITDAEVRDGLKVRAGLTAKLTELLGRDGVLILPTMADIAPKLTDTETALESYRNKSINLLCLSGLSKLPQFTMPLASRLGAPLGLSIMGPSGSDRSLIAICERLGA